MGHSHYGPVVMVHMVVVMVHPGKLLWSSWVSRYGPPKKSLWTNIRNIFIVWRPVSYPESKLIPEVSWRPLRMLIGSGSSLIQVCLGVLSVIPAIF